MLISLFFSCRKISFMFDKLKRSLFTWGGGAWQVVGGRHFSLLIPLPPTAHNISLYRELNVYIHNESYM